MSAEVPEKVSDNQPNCTEVLLHLEDDDYRKLEWDLTKGHILDAGGSEEHLTFPIQTLKDGHRRMRATNISYYNRGSNERWDEILEEKQRIEGLFDDANHALNRVYSYLYSLADVSEAYQDYNFYANMNRFVNELLSLCEFTENISIRLTGASFERL